MSTATDTVLAQIQWELRVPKARTNTFGGYNYRTCEDILEAVKPLLKKYQATLTVSDELELIGDRYYVKATSTICSIAEGSQPISVSAYARECEIKKGYDEAQITGSSSSYARKISLGGLFCCIDAQDPDAAKQPKRGNNTPKPKQNERLADKTADSELKAARQSIVTLAKSMMDEGYSREAIYKVIADNNDGKRMPSSIPSVEVCEKIKSEIKKLKKG